MAAHILSSVIGESIDRVQCKRALISVSDKTGLIDLVTILVNHNVEILSTVRTEDSFHLLYIRLVYFVIIAMFECRVEQLKRLKQPTYQLLMFLNIQVRYDCIPSNVDYSLEFSI